MTDHDETLRALIAKVESIPHSHLCADECYGRCRVCPADAIAELLAALRVPVDRPQYEIAALVKRYKQYRDQPTRYFNPPSAETLALDERVRHRENKFIDIVVRDLEALLPVDRPRGHEQEQWSEFEIVRWLRKASKEQLEAALKSHE